MFSLGLSHKHQNRGWWKDIHVTLYVSVCSCVKYAYVGSNAQCDAKVTENIFVRSYVFNGASSDKIEIEITTFTSSVDAKRGVTLIN